MLTISRYDYKDLVLSLILRVGAHETVIEAELCRQLLTPLTLILDYALFLLCYIFVVGHTTQRQGTAFVVFDLLNQGGQVVVHVMYIGDEVEVRRGRH